MRGAARDECAGVVGGRCSLFIEDRLDAADPLVEDHQHQRGTVAEEEGHDNGGGLGHGTDRRFSDLCFQGVAGDELIAQRNEILAAERKHENDGEQAAEDDAEEDQANIRRVEGDVVLCRDRIHPDVGDGAETTHRDQPDEVEQNNADRVVGVDTVLGMEQRARHDRADRFGVGVEALAVFQRAHGDGNAEAGEQQQNGRRIAEEKQDQGLGEFLSLWVGQAGAQSVIDAVERRPLLLSRQAAPGGVTHAEQRAEADGNVAARGLADVEAVEQAQAADFLEEAAVADADRRRGFGGGLGFGDRQGLGARAGAVF